MWDVDDVLDETEPYGVLCELRADPTSITISLPQCTQSALVADRREERAVV